MEASRPASGGSGAPVGRRDARAGLEAARGARGRIPGRSGTKGVRAEAGEARDSVRRVERTCPAGRGARGREADGSRGKRGELPRSAPRRRSAPEGADGNARGKARGRAVRGLAGGATTAAENSTAVLGRKVGQAVRRSGRTAEASPGGPRREVAGKPYGGRGRKARRQAVRWSPARRRRGNPTAVEAGRGGESRTVVLGAKGGGGGDRGRDDRRGGPPGGDPVTAAETARGRRGSPQREIPTPNPLHGELPCASPRTSRPRLLHRLRRDRSAGRRRRGKNPPAWDLAAAVQRNSFNGLHPRPRETLRPRRHLRTRLQSRRRGRARRRRHGPLPRHMLFKGSTSFKKAKSTSSPAERRQNNAYRRDMTAFHFTMPPPPRRGARILSECWGSRRWTRRSRGGEGPVFGLHAGRTSLRTGCGKR